MRRLPHFLYVGTDGMLFKIGITSCLPAVRAWQVGAELVRVYHRPYAREVESAVKVALADQCVKGTEWFAVSKEEIFAAVRKPMRVLDDYEAMIRGREPSPRPVNGQPIYDPPFDLPWLGEPTNADEKPWQPSA